MNVLISGAGIAGNALAFWLSKLGHSVTVIERFPKLRASGLQLDLRGHGIEVMRRMGLEEAFRANQAPEQGLEFVGSSGRRWAYFPANTSGEGLQGFTTDFEIMRGDLCHILHDATDGRVKYLFDISIENFEERDDSLHVTFRDGTTGQFDLLVGADGQGSRTRKLMMGLNNADGFYPLGEMYTGYVTIPQPIQEGEEYIATSYIAKKRRGIMTRRHSPGFTQAYLSCNTRSDLLKQAHRKGVRAEKEAMAEIFKGAGWKTEEIFKAVMEDNDFYCEHMGLVKLEHWHRGRVALLGDAAYCPSANTGMGTTSAIVGAYIMAGEIGRHCRENCTKGDLEAALEAYERAFRPFMDQVQKGLLEGDGWMDMLPTSSFGITMMNCLLGIASLLKINVMAQFVLREEVKGWDLPEYKEMLGAM